MRHLPNARDFAAGPLFLAAMFLSAVSLTAPRAHASESASFERTFTVSGHVRLELNNGSGNVEIRGSGDGAVHIRGTVTPGGSWNVFAGSQKSVQEVAANPPIEQHDSTIRVGNNASATRNVSIEYQIEVPKDTEVDGNVASGGITVDNVKGPVKANSASGYVHVYRVALDAQISAASGSIDVRTIGGTLRVNSASGNIEINDVKGDVKATAASGSISIKHPGDRVDVSSASGSLEIIGATNDLKAHAISGALSVSGNPGANRLWELKSVSGPVEIRVPTNASFLLSAEAISGDIRTGIPVILEEQNKHSLRAHVGDSSGRIEVRTVSGGIDLRGI
jgi:DUF4097 and DUF4098 domain-containing protein YvlB